MLDLTSAPRLLIAAHGTKSASGAATARAVAVAVAATRPDLAVSLCFLDVLEPSLQSALDDIDGAVVVVPMVLSAGYHVLSDIPSIVAGHDGVCVARHLGPEPALADVLAERLADARLGRRPASTALVAIGSSRAEAQAEVRTMARLLSERVGRKVTVIPRTEDLAATLAAMLPPVEIAPYLLVEGSFLSAIQETVSGMHWSAGPIGAHPALVKLVLARYTEIAATDVR